MASYGSTPLFHLVGITPEAPNLTAIDGGSMGKAQIITRADFDALRSDFGGKGDKVDVVVFAAPQLSIIEMAQVSQLLDGQIVHPETALLVCTSPTVAADSARLGFTGRIEAAGGKVLQGTCFYQQYAREIGEANGWVRLLSNSAKIVNILGGYGYQPALASMEECVASAIAGSMV